MMRRRSISYLLAAGVVVALPIASAHAQTPDQFQSAPGPAPAARPKPHPQPPAAEPTAVAPQAMPAPANQLPQKPSTTAPPNPDARHDALLFESHDGPMEIHVGDGGQVFGHYQRRGGRIVGHIGGDGVIEGLWLQTSSHHPCGQPREGTNAWGRFIIQRAWSGDPYGSWSYCDEVPNNDWRLRRH
jgi:hypothetical protein